LQQPGRAEPHPLRNFDATLCSPARLALVACGFCQLHAELGGRLWTAAIVTSLAGAPLEAPGVRLWLMCQLPSARSRISALLVRSQALHKADSLVKPNTERDAVMGRLGSWVSRPRQSRSFRRETQQQAAHGLGFIRPAALAACKSLRRALPRSRPSAPMAPPKKPLGGCGPSGPG